MRRFRFTIAGLLTVVVFVAVGFAALREATDFWDSATFTLTVAALLVSILLAVHRARTKRAFWLGFAVFGSAYLVLTLLPSTEPRLLTTRAMDYLGVGSQQLFVGINVRIWHSLFTVILAWLGGHLSRFIHARSGWANPESTGSQAPTSQDSGS
jgi:hypothetical protein